MNDDITKLVISRLDKLADKQEVQNVTLTRLTVSVEDHVRRTNILESRIKPMEEQFYLLRNGAIVIGAISGIVMTGLTALKLLGKV